MAVDSKIEWTHHTFNPWRGCTKVSAGCKNCYAETLSGRNHATLGIWGPEGTRVAAAASAWREPLKWNKAAAAKGERHRVFCASLADVFEDWGGPMCDSAGRQLYVAPSGRWSNDGGGSPVTEAGWRPLTMDDVRQRLFDLIDRTPHLDWLLLTKRPQNVERMTPDFRRCNCHVPEYEGAGQHSPSCAVFKVRPNVWLGTSVENQAAADERIPHLLNTPAAVRFLSCEPLLGPVGVTDQPFWDWRYAHSFYPKGMFRKPIDWIIVGGESGPGARPMAVEWARSLVAQCKAAGVACFVKQLGSNPEGDTFPEGERDAAAGNRVLHVRQVLTIRDKKGGDPAEWPYDLRVREFPKAA